MLSADTLPPSRYRTLARIGRGGMAEAFLAATRSNGVVKLAVLKCLWPELAGDAEFVEMFLDEARLSARLAHPNVVQVYEVLAHEGRLGIAMEYLHGQPLSGVLGRLRGPRALDLPTRLRIMTNVLAALEYAHTLKGFDGAPLEVVHRDVSPHNVIVTYDGHVKLLDFGVAKTIAGLHETRPGGVKGKLCYLAPEALRGDRVDRRADVFSAGVMLWEILAGRRLWDRANDNGVAWRLAMGEPSPALPPELAISPELRRISARALALDPAERHQSAAELAADLERAGADASDSNTRLLGRAVTQAFGGERTQREALIDFHLRDDADVGSDTVFDYDSFELSLLGRTTLHQRRAPRPFSPPPHATARSGPRPRGWSRTLTVSALAAAIALVSGAYLGRRADAWPTLPPLSRAAQTHEVPQSRGADGIVAAVATASPIIQPFEEPREPTDGAASPRPDHRARRERAPGELRARSRHPLDLAADDVLDLNGEPPAPPSGPSLTRDLSD